MFPIASSVISSITRCRSSYLVVVKFRGAEFLSTLLNSSFFTSATGPLREDCKSSMELPCPMAVMAEKIGGFCGALGSCAAAGNMEVTRKAIIPRRFLFGIADILLHALQKACPWSSAHAAGAIPALASKGTGAFCACGRSWCPPKSTFAALIKRDRRKCATM